ncbi:MAG: hypothetical protein ACI8ZB_001903 [Desulforhopalus sp.]|jgi:hypothetical protein
MKKAPIVLFHANTLFIAVKSILLPIFRIPAVSYYISNPGKRETSRDSVQYTLGVYCLPEGYKCPEGLLYVRYLVLTSS